MSKHLIPPRIILLVLFLAMLWGGNAVAIKIGLEVFAPLASAGIRFAVGLCLIAGWAWRRHIPLKPRSGEHLPLLALGLLFFLQIIFFNWGVNLTHAGRASVLINTYPLFVAAIAHFVVPDDHLTHRRMIGLCLAFGGILMVFWDSFTGGDRGLLVGDLLTLGSGFLLGLLIVLTNRLVQHINPYRLLMWEMLIGVPGFFLLSGVLEGRAGYGFSYLAMWALLYQGVVVAGFCFVAWTSILKYYSPSRLAVLFFTTPLWGIMISHFLLGEPITIGLGIGAAFVALGIHIVTRSQK